MPGFRKDVEDLLKSSTAEWRAYNATSRYEIDPELVNWYYPAENYLKKSDNMVRFDGDDENYYYNYNGEDDVVAADDASGGDGGKQSTDERGIPRHVIDDRAIRISNSKVIKKLVRKRVPTDSYFQPGELAVIESYDNPFRAPCRHVFGLFI
jgi:hypothetical protein